MSDYLESISNLYNLAGGDTSSTLGALCVFGFVIYVLIDAIKNKN